jgi:hypothetical protein
MEGFGIQGNWCDFLPSSGLLLSCLLVYRGLGIYCSNGAIWHIAPIYCPGCWVWWVMSGG